MMNFNLSAGRRVYLGGGSGGSDKGEADDSQVPELYIALLDDEYFSYPEVSQVWGEANCKDVLKASKKSLHLDWSRIQSGSGEHITVPLVEKIRPRWWYVAFVSCSSHSYELAYSLHLENSLRGWQSEFSMDAMGVFTMTFCLNIIFGGLMFAQMRSLREWHGFGHNSKTPKVHPALKMLSYSALLSLSGNVCWLVYYWYFMRSGDAPEYWAYLARLCIVSAKTVMQIMLMLLAQGQCVCSPDIIWADHSELVGGMVLFGCLSLGLELWGDTQFWTTTTEFVYDTRPGCVLVAFDVLWLWSFASKSYATFCKETGPRPRHFYRYYGPVFGLWFAALPLVAALARAVASWARFRVTFAASGLAHAMALAALVHSFRPCVACELYELRTQEYEALDSQELEGFLGEDDDAL